MKYRVRFTARALHDLDEMSGHTMLILLAWIRKHLEGSEEPLNRGKSMEEPKNEKWKYRIGPYRLITQLQKDEIIVLAVAKGHDMEIET